MEYSKRERQIGTKPRRYIAEEGSYAAIASGVDSTIALRFEGSAVCRCWPTGQAITGPIDEIGQKWGMARHIAASRSVQSVLAITGGLRAFQATYTTGKSLCHGCVTRGTENTSLMGDYHVASKATFKSKAQ